MMPSNEARRKNKPLLLVKKAVWLFSQNDFYPGVIRKDILNEYLTITVLTILKEIKHLILFRSLIAANCKNAETQTLFPSRPFWSALFIDNQSLHTHSDSYLIRSTI